MHSEHVACVHVRGGSRASDMATSSSTLKSSVRDLPDKPNQPLQFNFPARSFGLSKLVKRSFKLRGSNDFRGSNMMLLLCFSC